MKALTLTPWLATLRQIIDHPSSTPTTRTLARMLHAIILEADDERTAKILDHYTLQLMQAADNG
jgi:hypothetical protein